MTQNGINLAWVLCWRWRYSGFGISVPLPTHTEWTQWNRNLKKSGWVCGAYTWLYGLHLQLVTWGWLWKTRDTKEQLDNLDPKLEIKRYFYWMMWLGVYLFGVYWGGSFFTEQDASWHQVIIRDTSFTPSHVVVFYGSFPMYIVCGIASYLYAMTRLPQYSRGISFPLVFAIAGPLMILPNVGLNEWGHAFWFMEELFSAPLHWGFVILGWSGLFAGGVAAQIITRYSNLTDVIWNGQSKVILNNRL